MLTTRRLPVCWRTEITEWEHTHALEERPDGTLIRDTVLYRMPYGPLGEIAHRLLRRS